MVFPSIPTALKDHLPRSSGIGFGVNIPQSKQLFKSQQTGRDSERTERVIWMYLRRELVVWNVWRLTEGDFGERRGKMWVILLEGSHHRFTPLELYLTRKRSQPLEFARYSVHLIRA